MKQRPLVTGAARVCVPAALTAGLVAGGGVARAAANGASICGNVLGNAIAQPCAVAAEASSPPGGHPGGHPGHRPVHHPGHQPGRHGAHPAHPGHQGNPGRPGASGDAGRLAYPNETFAARPAPGEHGSGLLPHTGAPVGILGALAAAMLAAGIALTTAGRRRPAIATTALPTPTAQEGGGAATNESVRR